MLQVLIAYGNSGNDNCFHAILLGFVDQVPIGNVPFEVASRVVPGLLDRLRNKVFDDERSMVWNALHYLCDPSKNPNPSHIFRALESSSIADRFVEACENFPQYECNNSLEFLFKWVKDDSRRQNMVLKNSKLLAALFAVLDNGIAAIDYPAVGSVVTICACITSSDAHLDTLILLSGFAKLHNAFDFFVDRFTTLYQEGKVIDKEYKPCIISATTALANLHGSLTRQAAHVREVDPDRSLFCFTTESMERFTLSLNNAFDICTDHTTRASIIRCVIFGYGHAFARCITAPEYGTDIDQARRTWLRPCSELAKHLMLTWGPISLTGLLLKCVRDLCATEEYDGVPSSALLRPFKSICMEHPAVCGELLEARGERLAFCLLPTCNISNLKRGRLKKCVRCMKVWYCCKEHQVAHWPVHKKQCKAFVAEAAAAASAGDVEG